MSWLEYEQAARRHMESKLECMLPEMGVDINGKAKKFDLVNLTKKIAGDAKFYRNTASGNMPSAKRSTLNEYVWLLQKLPSDWKKFIVIGEDLEMAKKYVDDFNPWLGDVEIIFFERPDKEVILRKVI